MNINKVIKELAVLLFLASGMANAGLITIGGLTLENAGDSYVTDHVNNVDYLRWDQVKDLSYSELTTALQTGNAYDGWAIASNDEANDFVNALLDGSYRLDCATGNKACSDNFDYSNFERLLGRSYGNEISNYVWFLGDEGRPGRDLGYIEQKKQTINKRTEWNSVAYSDNWSSNGTSSHKTIGFLLYRDHKEAPEPSTLAIFALGMIGLASRRFKKK